MHHRRGARQMKFPVKSTFAINPNSITLVTILVVVSLFLIGVTIFDLVELKRYDIRFRLRGQQQPTPAVVMALIKEELAGQNGYSLRVKKLFI